jgi:carboxyl-terminal processing protease
MLRANSDTREALPIGYSLEMLLRPGALLVALVCAAAGQTAAVTAAERQANIESFEHVWKTVADKHWDPKLNGLDWRAIHDELRPKVENAKNMDEARAAMADMLARLNLTHFGIFPQEVYKELGDAEGSREANPGIGARVLDDRAVVVSVDPGSPAAEKGVKTGWEIVRIDGKELEPGLRKIREQFGKSTLLDIRQTRSVDARLMGNTGTQVKIDFRDGTDRPVALELGRVKPRGKPARLGNLPPMYFWAESKRVQQDIGYLKFNAFLEPEALVNQVEDAVKSCRDCKGFVIDLRGNPGGIGGLAMGVGAWFIDKPGLKLGTMTMRTGTIKFVLFPRTDPFRGPLAVLVDGCSGSTAEIFAGGMKDLKRARVFGTRSAGAALPSIIERLPNGDGFQYAIANYVAEGGQPLEGIGVIPDQEVRLTRHQLLEGQDPVLDAAVEWVQKQK